MRTKKRKPFSSELKTKQALIAALITIMLFGTLAVGCQQSDKIQPKQSIAVGTWIDSHKIAEKDNAPHPMKYRIEAIIRDQETVMAAISEYNLSGTGNIIGQLQNDKLEFCMAEYSATYPEDFPQSNFGITDVAIPFEIVSLTGGTIQVGDTVYQNLETTWEIGELPQGYDFHAGDTYSGKIIFIMAKGYSDFLIHEIKEESLEGEQIYIKGE